MVDEVLDIYEIFPDGWDFTPSVSNNSKTRAEVFTPLPIVNKMITESGIVPTEAIRNEYTLNNTEIDEIIKSRVLEPAVGTGNFIATILWHKLNYAYVLAKREATPETLQAKVEENFLKVFSNTYAFDIDPGNMQTVFERVFGRFATPDPVNYWSSKILALLNVSIDEELVKVFVENSLAEGKEHWGRLTSGAGVLEKLQLNLGLEEFSESFIKNALEIFAANFLLFNGIVEEDTITDDLIVPGYNNVVWRWWNITADNITYDLVSLKGQLLSAQREQLIAKMEEFKNEFFKPVGDGLFASMEWVDAQSEREFNKMSKELGKIDEALLNVSKGLAAVV